MSIPSTSTVNETSIDAVTPATLGALLRAYEESECGVDGIADFLDSLGLEEDSPVVSNDIRAKLDMILDAVKGGVSVQGKGKAKVIDPNAPRCVANYAGGARKGERCTTSKIFKDGMCKTHYNALNKETTAPLSTPICVATVKATGKPCTHPVSVKYIKYKTCATHGRPLAAADAEAQAEGGKAKMEKDTLEATPLTEVVPASVEMTSMPAATATVEIETQEEGEALDDNYYTLGGVEVSDTVSNASTTTLPELAAAAEEQEVSEDESIVLKKKE